MNIIDRRPPTTKRVGHQTDPLLNDAIRQRTDGAVIQLETASPQQITARLDRVGKEWDVERLLQTNASILCLAGLGLGAKVDRRYLLLPAAAFGFLAQHALQGWCPPIPVFRRLGVRTMREIERERYALKACVATSTRCPRQIRPPPASGYGRSWPPLRLECPAAHHAAMKPSPRESSSTETAALVTAHPCCRRAPASRAAIRSANSSP